MSRKAAAALATVLVASTGLLFAQDTPPAFRSGIELLTIPVRVLDRDGRRVEGLTPSHFEVRVDGTPRKVVSAEAVLASAGRAEERAPAMRTYSTNTASGPSAVARTFLVVIDAGGFDTPAARGAAEQAEKWLDALPPGELVGFTTIPTPVAAIAPTTDRPAVRAALQRVTGGIERHPLQFEISAGEAIRIHEQDQFVFENVARRECNLAPWVRVYLGSELPCVSPVEREAVRLARVVRDQMARRLRALLGAIETLPATPDVKHVVLITPGVFLESGSEARYRELGLALAARTAVLSIIHVENSEGTAEERTRADTPDWQLSGNAMQQLAGITGGDLFRHGTLVTRFERFGRELNGYYVLALETEPGDLDGKRHQLKVLVRGRDVQVQHAPGFVRSATPAQPSSADRDLAAVMRRPALERGVPLAVQTTTLRGSDPERLQVLAIVRIGQVADEASKLSKDGRTRIAMEVFDGGRLVSAHEGRVEHAGADLSEPYVATLPLPPGRFRLRVGVLDAAGRSGSVDHAFVADLPAAGPVRISGLLVWPTQAGAARPRLDFSTGEPLSASVEIYAMDAAAARNAAVTFVLANLSDPTMQRAFSNAARQSDGGIQRVVASIDPSGLPPGEYVVRAEVGAGGPAVAAAQHIVLHGATASPPLTEHRDMEASVGPYAAASEKPPYPSADLPASVSRASTYVDRYFRELTHIVMDESYQQQLRSPSTHTGSRLEIRRLHSEVLLVTLPAPAGPTAFRDVLTVDGRAVRNRDDRLRRLFLEEQDSRCGRPQKSRVRARATTLARGAPSMRRRCRCSSPAPITRGVYSGRPAGNTSWPGSGSSACAFAKSSRRRSFERARGTRYSAKVSSGFIPKTDRCGGSSWRSSSGIARE